MVPHFNGNRARPYFTQSMLDASERSGRITPQSAGHGGLPRTSPHLTIGTNDAPFPLRRVRNGRRTIALLIDYIALLDEGFEAELRKSMDAHCGALDLNLIIMYGRAVEEPNSAAHNALFDLVHREWIDGLVVVSTCLSGFCGTEGMLRFVDRYAGLPMCSIGIALPGVPSVVLDNRPGMAAVIEHILVDHDCRRVAFLRGPMGNPEATTRFEVYRELLTTHGIEFDPMLVANGQFVKTGGRVAMEEILRRGTPIDAVIASNDTMAIGAIEALREHGHHVPGDIPVTGFDDLMLSRLCNPALTTVAQPFSAMTQAALHMVLEQLAGRTVPEMMALSTRFVVRRSCGCNAITYGSSTGALARSPLSLSYWLSEHAVQIRNGLARRLCRSEEDGLREAEQLLAALEQALHGRPEPFYSGIEAMLESAGAGNEHYRAIHDAISYLRQELSSFKTVALESLFCDAISLIAMANTTAQLEHRLSLDAEYSRLITIGEGASLALDFPSLRRELMTSLPTAGFATAFVSILPASTDTELESLVSLVEGQPVAPAEPRFDARRIIPVGVLPPERRYTLLAFPLTRETQLIGVAVFAYSPRLSGYALARDQIGAALRSVFLHQEVLAKTVLHQRSVQERQAAAQRLQALNVLAGGVAHDLNNALGPLVALPDVLLQELQDFELSHGTGPQLSEDIISIRTAATRASQTIKDLLTLGRQGKTARQPVELNRVIEECIAGDFARFLRELHPGAQLVLELSEKTLVVRAAEAQLARAINNLVRNAAEAMPKGGRVTIRSSFTCLTAPIAGYDTVQAGDYAIITVTDTGVGIPAAHLERVFEPFFSGKPAGEHSGTGLGLAIVKGVVNEHDGYIHVSSRLGEGTEFAVYLPTVAELPRNSDRVPPSRTRDANILIVDDDPAQLRTGRRVLARLGYRVETSSSARTALETFARAAQTGRAPYDLVILDMMLNSELDGLQLFERIRELFPRQPAIIASGQSPTQQVEGALERGLTWLSKPYTMRSLARAVLDAFESQARARETH